MTCAISELATVAALPGAQATGAVLACENAGKPALPATDAEVPGDAFRARFRVMFHGMHVVPRSDLMSEAKSILERKAAAAQAASGAAGVPVELAKERARDAAASALQRGTSELREKVIDAVTSIVKLPRDEVLSILTTVLGHQLLDTMVGEVASAVSAVAPVVRTAKEATMTAKSGGQAGWKKYKQSTVKKEKSRLAEGPPQAALRCVSRLLGRAVTQNSIDAGRHGTSLATSVPADVITILGVAGIPFTFGGSAIIVPVSEALLGYTGSFAVAVAGLVQKLCVMVRDVSEVRKANYYLEHPDEVTDERVFEECPYLGLWWLLLASDGELSTVPPDQASAVREYGSVAQLRNWLMRRRDWQQTNVFEWAQHRDAVRAAANSLMLSYDYALVRETEPTSPAAAAAGTPTIEEVKPPLKPAWDDKLFTLYPRQLSLTRFATQRVRQLMSVLSADSADAVLEGLSDYAMDLQVPA